MSGTIHVPPRNPTPMVWQGASGLAWRQGISCTFWVLSEYTTAVARSHRRIDSYYVTVIANALQVCFHTEDCLHVVDKWRHTGGHPHCKSTWDTPGTPRGIGQRSGRHRFAVSGAGAGYAAVQEKGAPRLLVCWMMSASVLTVPSTCTTQAHTKMRTRITCKALAGGHA